ncbi:MAG: Transcription termination factor Rho, partial [uncultured Quadrisphaera sp.]
LAGRGLRRRRRARPPPRPSRPLPRPGAHQAPPGPRGRPGGPRRHGRRAGRGQRRRRAAARRGHPRRARQLRLHPHLGLPLRAERRVRQPRPGAQGRPARGRRRHRRRPPAARGRAAAGPAPGEVQRPGAARHRQRGQRRRGAQAPGVLQAHPAVPAGAAAPGDRAEHRRHPDRRPRGAHRQGPARAHRQPAQGGQDADDAGDRQRDQHQQPRGPPHGRARRRAARGGHRHAAVGQGRGHRLDLRPPGLRPHRGRGAGHRAGQAPGRAGQRRGRAARLDHPPRARLQPRRPGERAHPLRRRRRRRAVPAEAVLRRGAQHRARRLADHPGLGPGRDRLEDGRGDLRGVQGHREHGAPPRPAPRRQAHLPGGRRQPLGHAARGDPARPRGARGDVEAAPGAHRARLPAGPGAAAGQGARDQEQRRVPHAGAADRPVAARPLGLVRRV